MARSNVLTTLLQFFSCRILQNFVIRKIFIINIFMIMLLCTYLEQTALNHYLCTEVSSYLFYSLSIRKSFRQSINAFLLVYEWDTHPFTCKKVNYVIFQLFYACKDFWESISLQTHSTCISNWTALN